MLGSRGTPGMTLATLNGHLPSTRQVPDRSQRGQPSPPPSLSGNPQTVLTPPGRASCPWESPRRAAPGGRTPCPRSSDATGRSSGLGGRDERPHTPHSLDRRLSLQPPQSSGRGSPQMPGDRAPMGAQGPLLLQAEPPTALGTMVPGPQSCLLRQQRGPLTPVTPGGLDVVASGSCPLKA